MDGPKVEKLDINECIDKFFGHKFSDKSKALWGKQYNAMIMNHIASKNECVSERDVLSVISVIQRKHEALREHA